MLNLINVAMIYVSEEKSLLNKSPLF